MGFISDMPINLTANNGLRDEDPKFSPNGNEIVFKQNGDLKVMDLINDTIIHTTGKNLKEHGSKISESDKKAIEAGISDLRNALKGTDTEEIKRKHRLWYNPQ